MHVEPDPSNSLSGVSVSSKGTSEPEHLTGAHDRFSEKIQARMVAASGAGTVARAYRCPPRSCRDYRGCPRLIPGLDNRNPWEPRGGRRLQDEGCRVRLRWVPVIGIWYKLCTW